MRMTAWTPRVAIILSIVALNLHGASAQSFNRMRPILKMDPAAPKVGEKVTLVCGFSAKDQEVMGPVTYTWTLDPEPQGWTETSDMMFGGILAIEKYEPQNIHMYTCRGVKDAGTPNPEYSKDSYTLSPATTTPAPTTPAPTTPAPTTPAVVTKEIKLESWNWNYYARSWAHLGSVQSMVLVKEHDYVQEHASPLCHEEGDNATFGFHGATTWVKDGCRGDFTVIFDTADTTSAEFDRLAGRLEDLDEETEFLESTLESQNAKIAELRCMMASLNEDDPMHKCCCPIGWTAHRPDGKLICYRQVTTNDKDLKHTEAEPLCQNLHARSTLVMPKTAAQLDVVKSFMTTTKAGEADDDDDEHLGMDIGAGGDYTWQDGTAADKQLLGAIRNSAGGEGSCMAGWDLHWSHDVDSFTCYYPDLYTHADGKVLCQLIPEECEEGEY